MQCNERTIKLFRMTKVVRGYTTVMWKRQWG